MITYDILFLFQYEQLAGEKYKYGQKIKNNFVKTNRKIP